MKLKHLLPRAIPMCCFLLFCAVASAQVNSGSDGSDGVFNPTTNTVINLTARPDGIYHYTSVNIPSSVTVSFIPNANNTPVVWLVQSNCVIAGTVDVSGMKPSGVEGAPGGPGGFRGGNSGWASGTAGQGPGGGMLGGRAFSASHARVATLCNSNMTSGTGPTYGTKYVLPLIGGSGGGGTTNWNDGAGGGGGALLIAASQSISLSGSIRARGGDERGANLSGACTGSGGGSGGVVRLVSTVIIGGGTIDTTGGIGGHGLSCCTGRGGRGWIRLDGLDLRFTGNPVGEFSQGFQPIILLPPSQAIGLAVESVGNLPVPANPTGVLISPDVIVPGQQANPLPVVVRCLNIPLNTQIFLDIKPVNGQTITVTGQNTHGTEASSTATLWANMPRGSGTIQARAISGIAGTFGASLVNPASSKNYAQYGLTADGEEFEQLEITSLLGGKQHIAYVTGSGKRYVLPHN